GTGEGKFVYRLAHSHPEIFYIGIDSSQDSLKEYSVKISKKPSRGGLPNVLYVVANAEDLPLELNGLVKIICINFPWGSLLKGVVRGDDRILAGIARISSKPACLEMRINYSLFFDPVPLEIQELPELTFDYIDQELAPLYAKTGITFIERKMLLKEEVKDISTTWAKKLGYGREAKTIYIRAQISS
ncbi:MAG: class I SAM-dependent methyltransferase, partial [Nitrospira sp.]|nr:class I SAM-dependent methyltransferase [Nitrospira sp.]